MISSSKLEVQLIVDACKKVGVKHVVVSPGSRNAPFSIAFDEDPHFEVFVVADERAAAFYALGMAQKSEKPVVITCTSGSAPLNYYPAIAEAFYQEIPLIVLSADRPKEWIDQGDGQTIRQQFVFDQMVLKSAQLDEIHTPNQRWHAERILSELFQAGTGLVKGPVHLNVPFSEPLYETTFEIETLNQWIQQAETESTLSKSAAKDLKQLWEKSSKRLIIVGQQTPTNELESILELLAKDGSVAVLTEHTSNVQSPYFISTIDRTLNVLPANQLSDFQPDCIVSVGGAIVSKKIKAFLRQAEAPVIRFGFHFPWMDTYKNLVFTAEIKPLVGLELLLNFTQAKPHQSNFGSQWLKAAYRASEQHQALISQVSWSDLFVMKWIMDVIPDNTNLHVSNSSLIRYTLLFDPIKSLKYWCNRGTSGIDGSSSTAVGSAIQSPAEFHLLVTGDLSFFYDSNAWWSQNLPPNLRVILVNNGGGDIFNIIPGPNSTNQWKKIFVAEQQLESEHVALTFGLDYFKASSESELEACLEKFFLSDSTSPKILEINTMKVANSTVLEDYFKGFKK